MSKTCVNFGGADWHVDMTIEQLEKAYGEAGTTGEFITLPLLFDNAPHAVIRVRPSEIRYYLEQLS